MPENEILGQKNKELFHHEQNLKGLRREADRIKKAFKSDTNYTLMVTLQNKNKALRVELEQLTQDNETARTHLN